MKGNEYLESSAIASASNVRANLATGFAAVAMTVYLWVQIAQVVMPPLA